jgi:hypothetical protein
MSDYEMMHFNGWTFDPSREVWYVKTSANTWTEVKGDIDNPPSWAADAEIMRRQREIREENKR